MWKDVVKQEVLSISNGSKYIREIDTLVPNISQEQAEKIQDRIVTVKAQIAGKSGRKYDNIQAIISYLEIVLYENFDLMMEETVEIPTQISTQDAMEAKEQVLTLQGYLKDSLNKNIAMFEEHTIFRETWDMSVSMDIDVDQMMMLNSEVTLNNYIYKHDMFDEELQWDLRGLIHADIAGEQWLSVKFETFLDYILKDGNVYLMFDNIDFEDRTGGEIREQLTPILDELTRLAKEETYISIIDEEAQDIINTFQDLAPGTIINHLNQTLDTPLLEAYIKEGNTYFMRPTIELCHIFKDEKNVFDPINGTKCSEKQYQDMLQSMQESNLEIYLIDATNETWQMMLSIEWKYDRENQMITTLSWNDTHMKSIDIEYRDKMEKFISQVMMDETWKISTGDMVYNGAWGTVTGKYANDKLSLIAEIRIDEDSNMSCEFSGPLTEKYIDINGGCDMYSPLFSEMWIPSDTLSMTFNTLVDMTSDTQQMEIYADVSTPSKKVFNINIKNTSRRSELLPGTIQAPKYSIPLEELMGNTMMQY